MDRTDTFEIRLDRTNGARTPADRIEPSHYDAELDDIGSIISDVCEALEESGAVKFVVSGFGEARWKVDVATDLATVLEQAAPVAHWLGERGVGEFPLDFYEQGVERRLVLAVEDGWLMARGQPMFDAAKWQPTPAVEQMPVSDFKDMLLRLVDGFAALALQLAPEHARHPWFLAWVVEVQQALEAP
jgi:hypothetical protein